jgi:hypothetical protein
VETKPEINNGKRKIPDYVRWFVSGAFGLLLLFTIFMAAYRKFGG